MRFVIPVLIALMAISVSGCEGPTAGEVAIDLVTPNSGDGAVLFRIETPSTNALGDITAACPGCQAFAYRTGDSEVFCVVTGPLASGPLARVVVSNVGARSGYSVQIIEVADMDHGLRSTEGYELIISR